MVCYVSKWVRVVYLRSVSCAQCYVMLVSGVRVVYLRSVSCPQWCVMLVSGVRVVYLRSVSCAQCYVMLVSGSVLFIFVLCPVLNVMLC
jgi:phage FluMu protein Com